MSADPVHVATGAPAVGPPAAGGRRPGRAVLSDRWAVVVAVAAAAGAWSPRSLPWLVVVAAVAGAVLSRRPPVVALAVALVVSALSQRAWDGLDPAQPGPVRGEVTLVGDPERVGAGVRVVARLDGERVELWAYGRPATTLRRRLAGERVTIDGTRRPRSSEQIAANPWRRVVGRVEVAAVTGTRPGALPYRLANEVHQRLADGAAGLGDDRRALLAGLVLGDDRDQPAVLRDAFTTVGLTHLLAVSGQNVAFVLAAAGPMLRRFRLWPRLATVLGLLAFFALVTRFEPSVLRAAVMAALAATATAAGRPSPGLRVLALAVTGLLFIDPLLVRALGFQLSVLASGGILVAAPRLAASLPLRPSVATAVAVPLAAQLATAPLLLARTGGLAAVSVPANVLVEPAAGAVMTWGSSAGVAAGWLPAPLATVIHVPTRLLLWWIDTVAVVAARFASFAIGGRALVAGALVAAALWVGGRLAARRRGNAPGAPPSRDGAGATDRLSVLAKAAAVTSTVFAVAVWSPAAGPPPPLPTGVAVYRHGPDEIVVLGGPCDGARLLAALRARDADRPEVVVVTSPAASTWRSASEVLAALRPELLLTATGRPGAVTVSAGAAYRVGAMLLTVGGVSSAGPGPVAPGGEPGPITVSVAGAEVAEPP